LLTDPIFKTNEHQNANVHFKCNDPISNIKLIAKNSYTRHVTWDDLTSYYKIT